MEIINNEAIISDEVATEFGFIEKLCATFGFIKCLNKENPEKRLFFHSSEVKCGFEDMKINDYVTFIRGIGNGKPLARKVVIKRREGEREEGVIVRMAKKNENGSISYKFKEECFYVQFDRNDVMEPGKLKVKDDVTFERADREGVTVATNICKKYNKPMRMQGIVTCIKDKYGFIDRCDLVKEIYFVASPYYTNMVAGTEVEFNVKHLRNGKEEAVNLRMLDPGTVQFVDILDTVLYGTLLRCPDTKRATSGDQLTGNISYACPSEAKVLQIPFSEKDKLYPYSLHPGDIVSFKVAVDRRDELHHACCVKLFLDQFPSRKETRHFGVIKMYDSPAGLIEPDLINRADQDDMLVAFKDKEWIVPDEQPLTKFIAVSYTPVQILKQLNGHTKSTVTALRIMPLKSTEQMVNLKLYPSGSLRGTIKATIMNPDDLGIVICQLESSNVKRSIPFTHEDVTGPRPKIGDEVTFGCLERFTNPTYLPPSAFDVTVVTNRDQLITVNNSSCSTATLAENSKSFESRKLRSRTLPENKIITPVTEELPQLSPQFLRGWVVIFKEHFGFIETSDHRTLYKFSPGTIKKSNLSSELSLGCAVEFSPWTHAGKRMVDVITKIITEPLSEEKIVLSKRVGKILQPILITESNESQYHGVIVDCETERPYPFTMHSLAYFGTKLFINERVLFNVSQVGEDSSLCRASGIFPLRQMGHVTEAKENLVTIERSFIDENDMVVIGVPATFKVDCDQVAGSSGSLGLDDTIQLELDLDYKSRELFVASYKLIKSAEPASIRKVYKPVDDLLQPRILHWRTPRLPEGESIGFSADLRREPAPRC